MDTLKPFIELKEIDNKTVLIYDETGEFVFHGWGNGYVHLPPGHKWYGKNHDKIPVEVHGGLTYSEWDEEKICWVIGFDTNHSGDTLEKWPREAVLEETERLLQQCL